jgi:site-specific DNA recombinase
MVTTGTRAAIVLRLSEDPFKGTEREGEGVARQGEDCEEHAERNGWPVAVVDGERVVLVDNDRSALRRRPGFERLMKLIETGRINVVVAWSSERLLKTKTDEYRFYETCLNAPEPVIVSYARGMTFDLSTPQGRKFFDNAASDARYETELKSERQRRANRQHAEKGQPPAGPRPFGYEKDRVTLRKAEAEYGVKVYRAILAGSTLASQVRVLNRAGLRTGQGHLWRPETLRTWLLSPRNAGLRAHRGEIVAKAVWPALIDEPAWLAVKAILESPTRKLKKGKSARALLTGVALCGVCGETVNMGGATKTGAKTYVCRTGRHVARAVIPVDKLVSAVACEIIDRDGADLLKPRKNVDEKALRTERKSIEQRVRQLGQDFALGVIERPTLHEGTEAARIRLTEIEEELADSGRVDILGEAVEAESASDWWYSKDVTDEQRRKVIDTIMTVRILPAVRGRKGFDPETVEITPKK